MTRLSSSAAPPAPAASTADVVIVGDGVVGLALALALARPLSDGHTGAPSYDRDAGGPVTLLVRGPRTDTGPTAAAVPDSRAVSLSAASVRLLTALGVWEAIAPAAQPVSAIDITDSALTAGLRPVLLSYENTIADGAPAAHIVPDGVLRAALWAAVHQTPGITLRTGGAVTALTGNGEQATLTLSSAGDPLADRGPVALTGRLVVAADGASSRVRTLARIGTVGWAYRQHGLTVTIAHEMPHNGRAVQHFLPGGPFAILPLLGGHRSCVTWSEGETTARAMMALPEAAFADELARRIGGRLGAVRLDGPRQSWPLASFLARSFIGPRLALIGDAAHSVHPIAGQGLNLGLKDVAALAEVVVEARRSGLDAGRPEILARYERWRRFDTLTAATGFDALNRLFSNDVGVLRSLRSFGLEMVDRVPMLKRGLVAEAAGLTGTLPRLLRGEPL